MLVLEGRRLITKRVHRVYRALGLQVRRIRRKKLVRVWAPTTLLTRARQEWALHFTSDVRAGGFRVLSVIDGYTGECLALDLDTRFPSRAGHARVGGGGGGT